MATADGLGNIFNDVFAPNEQDQGVRFYLTANGVGSTAQVTFTDAANKATFSLTSNGSAITSFNNVGQNQCFAVWVQARQGNALDVLTQNETVGLTSSPSGATFFLGGSCSDGAVTSIAAASGQGAWLISFRIGTTGNFTISGDASWSGGSNDASATAAVVGAPTVVSINRSTGSPTNAASVSWTVTFNKSVTGVDVSDFGLNTNLGGPPTVTNVAGSGASYTVTASTGTGTGTIGLDLNDDDSIADTTNPGNKLGGTGTGSAGSGGVGNGSFSGQSYLSIARLRLKLQRQTRPTTAPQARRS